ncbi:uncharacterized protein LOC144592307 [Rhinoraja longicauda]
MVERLEQEDNGLYQCNVNDLSGRPLLLQVTRLIVRAPVGNSPAVTGTERGSATLHCVFPAPAPGRVPFAVTWMRKDPYRHIVTFRPQANGSWAVENGATRLELVGNPERGNATTRIKQLRVEDSHGYLCLVEMVTSTPFPIPLTRDMFQCEIQLQVATAPQFSYAVILCIPLGVKTLVLLVMGFILFRDKTRCCLTN